jgi:outer membrane protein assembly factor BamB
MILRRTRALAFLPLAAVMILGLSGCPFSPEKDKLPITPPQTDYLPQSSALNVLENLKTSYEKREFLEYNNLFSEDYIFVFNPADVEDPFNPTPQQWARADEMDSAENLFANDRVDGISLNWVIGELAADDTYPGHPWKIRVDNVQLDVQTRAEDGTVWIYQVNGATHVYYFREGTGEQASDGKTKWYCTRWEDSPLGFFKAPVAEL